MQELVEVLNRIADAIEKLGPAEDSRVEDKSARLVDDDFKVFVDKHISSSPGSFLTASDLALEVISWADENGLYLSDWTQTKVTQQMRKLGFKYDRKYIDGNQQRGFSGIKLA